VKDKIIDIGMKMCICQQRCLANKTNQRTNTTHKIEKKDKIKYIDPLYIYKVFFTATPDNIPVSCLKLTLLDLDSRMVNFTSL